MEEHSIRFINSEDLQVAASCETRSNELTEVYLPSTVLFYIAKGQLNINLNQELISVERGRFGLLRKYTECSMFKTWTPEEGEAKVYMFALTNKFIKRVIHHFDISRETAAISDRFFDIPSTPLLKGLIHSISAYVEEGVDLDPNIMELKTLEALHALVAANKDLLGVFKEFAISERADLEKLMNHNYLYNIPLQDLAVQSGRSLSTFNREFRALFKETPHKWIKQKRLQFARNMMITKNMKPSEVYLEAGFEDLAHFSKSFKGFFKITPSQFYQSLA
ncbi:AraC family transcriptional regulator [Seonamhaeicola sp.]|uniref:helix-turn-helix domain-containing protein n=1 Tax=Seonamhaeicola sp. TaxID=1912245 RepID=UPI002623F86F|nr:AraC family transcriptional regulator [Seonamhaeicola sp.]